MAYQHDTISLLTSIALDDVIRMLIRMHIGGPPGSLGEAWLPASGLPWGGVPGVPAEVVPGRRGGGRGVAGGWGLNR